MTIISTTPAGANGNGHAANGQTTNGHRPPAQRPGQPGVIQLLREADATERHRTPPGHHTPEPRKGHQGPHWGRLLP